VKILIAVAILVFLYWIIILRPGRLDFWKLAGKYPDEAYDLFMSEDCWKVFEENPPDDHQSIVPKEDWTGPFRLMIPKLGNKTIHVLGRYPICEESQNEFMTRHSKREDDMGTVNSSPRLSDLNDRFLPESVHRIRPSRICDYNWQSGSTEIT
jgi:hypothetical protein